MLSNFATHSDLFGVESFKNSQSVLLSDLLTGLIELLTLVAPGFLTYFINWEVKGVIIKASKLNGILSFTYTKVS